MSTAQSKTDEGPEEIISESEDLSDGDGVHHKSRTGAKEHEEDVTTLPEVQIDGLEGQRARTNGDLFEGYENAKKSDEATFDNGADLLNSLEERRPSSADGSLSTPDDTPSLQVFHTVERQQYMFNSSRIPYCLLQQVAAALFVEMIVLRRLCVRSTDAFRHVCHHPRSIHHEQFRQLFLTSTLVNRRSQATCSKMLRSQNLLMLHGRS